jgi:integrase/recombinase XerC
LALTGLRPAEALSLAIGSFDGPAGERRITTVGKGDKARAIRIPEELEAVIAPYLVTRAERFSDKDPAPDHSPVRPCRRDGTGAPPGAVLFERLYMRAGIRAQLPPGALVHAPRPTFATAALSGGASVLEVQAVLRHQSLDTTKPYLEATPTSCGGAVMAHPARRGLMDTALVLGRQQADTEQV